MRIARFVAGGDPKYGVVELAEDCGDNPQTVAVLTGDPLAGPVQYTGERLPLVDVRLVAPVIPRSKVVGIGKNYTDHIAELGGSVPAEPVLFFKPNTSVIGPGESIVRPPETKLLHHEGELAIVIGRICRRVPIERVPEVIFGYTIANDVTARDLQAIDDQWARSKGFDTFCPIGPWIVTHLSLDEANDLELRTLVNGEVRQEASTKLMLRGVAQLVAQVSAFTTLLPGDLILTGTPAGISEIAPGDQVTVEISGIGELTNPIVAEED